MQGTFILSFFFFLAAFGSSAQTIERQNHRFGGMPIIQGSNRLFREGQNHVWTNNENFGFPSRNSSQSGFSYPAVSLGLLPEGNTLIQAWKSASGQTWLASRYLPSCTQWPGPCNGGLLKATNLENGGSFQLFNSLTYVAMQTITESVWHCGVPVDGGNTVWLSSELGLRKLDVNTLNSTLISHTDIPISLPLTLSKELQGTPFFGNSDFQWLFIHSDLPKMLNPEMNFQLPARTRISDLALSGADTLFLADTSMAESPVFHLFKRSNGITIQLTGTDSLEKIAVQGNGAVWMSGTAHGLFMHRSNQSIPIPFFQNMKVVDFVIDSLNQKWILTSTSDLYRLSDVVPKIQSDSVILLCDSATWQFRDASASINGAIQTRLWQFGDGQTSTEANPTHRYEREGLYIVTLNVTDVSGSEASTTDTVLVTGSLYLSLKNRTPIVSCQPVRLEAYGTSGFHWRLPGGGTDSSFAILATQSGVYRVSASKAGCTFTDSVQVTLQSGSSPIDIRIEKPDGSPLEDESTAFFPLALSANAGPVTELCSATWKLDGRPLSESLLPVEFTVAGAGTHVLEVNGYNYTGCPVFGKKEFVLAEPFLPNLVTENSDGKNDYFEIPALRFLAENTLTLYNRWGQEVFTASPYRNNWPEGDAQPGTYFYRLEAGGKIYTGWVMVLK